MLTKCWQIIFFITIRKSFLLLFVPSETDVGIINGCSWSMMSDYTEDTTFKDSDEMERNWNTGRHEVRKEGWKRNKSYYEKPVSCSIQTVKQNFINASSTKKLIKYSKFSTFLHVTIFYIKSSEKLKRIIVWTEKKLSENVRIANRPRQSAKQTMLRGGKGLFKKFCRQITVVHFEPNQHQKNRRLTGPMRSCQTSLSITKSNTTYWSNMVFGEKEVQEQAERN